MPKYYSYMIHLLPSLLLISGLSSAAAGENGIFKPGQRVRVVYKTGITKDFGNKIRNRTKEFYDISGNLISWKDDTILVTADSQDSQTKIIPMAAVRNIYVSIGQQRSLREGIAVGAAFGILVAYGAIATQPSFPEKERWVERHPALAAAIYFGGGMIVGGIIGWFVKVDRWKEVDRRDWPVELNVDRQHGGYGLRLVYAF